MPLVHKPTPEAFARNVAAEVAAGRPRGQAVAVAYRTGRDAWYRDHPHAPLPLHLGFRTRLPRSLTAIQAHAHALRQAPVLRATLGLELRGMHYDRTTGQTVYV